VVHVGIVDRDLAALDEKGEDLLLDLAADLAAQRLG